MNIIDDIAWMYFYSDARLSFCDIKCSLDMH